MQEALYFSLLKLLQMYQKKKIFSFYDTFCSMKINDKSTRDFHKTGDAITHAIIRVLENHEYWFPHCHGQWYGNGSNMTSYIKGVQARIKQKNLLATISPSAAHSLNLVVLHTTTQHSGRYVQLN